MNLKKHCHTNLNKVAFSFKNVIHKIIFFSSKNTFFLLIKIIENYFGLFAYNLWTILFYDSYRLFPTIKK